MNKKIFLLAVFAFSFYASAFAQKRIPPEKPKLIVGIVVEQMRYDYIFRFWDKFGQNGFKRLINEGTFCRNANYNYLLTQSAPGYATIATGTTPSHHGIVANNWYQRLKNQNKYCVEGSDFKSIGAGGDAGKKSPAELITSTITDELRLATFKESKVIGISVKDYSAILPAGHLGNAAFWFDEESGNWITSSYYMDTLPKWVNEFNTKKIHDLYLQREWNTLYSMSEYTECLSDNNSYEQGFGDKQTFPYAIPAYKSKMGYKILKYTPFGNTYTKDFAISALINENLGKDNITDFLNIGFSATGFVSDIFGIRSVEMQDIYLRLDQDLEHLLNSLDDLVGKENVLVYLTADCGAADNPRFLADINMTGNFFNAKSTVVVLKSYLKAIYGQGDWVKAYSDRQIYLNQNLIEDSKMALDQIQTKTALFLVQFTGVANTVTATTFQTTNFTDGILEKAQNSYNPERSGDVFINLAPGWSEIPENDKAISLSGNHSAYSYDTHVPLIWYGWKMKRTNIYRPVSITDIAPTLAQFLNISFPNACTGKPIIELLE